MYTTNMFRHLVWGALLLGASYAQGQATVLGNAGGPLQFLGWNAATMQPLEVRHDGNQPIDLYTDGNRRATLSQTLTVQSVNSINNLDLTGFLGVGDFDNTPGIYRYPAAKVHTDRTSTVEYGFRSMIRDGFLATQGEVLYYGGLLDATNAGIIWSRSTGAGGTPGSFRFIYTGYNGSTNTEPSETAPGLELGRFEPASTLDQGYFGIGNWAAAAATPDERLDVLDRTIRIRRLFNDYQNNNLTQVVVADINGRLHWRDISTFPGGSGTDCRWGNGVNNSVVTAVNGVAGLCRDGTKRVGIGTANPQSKFDVTYPAGGTTGTAIAGIFYMPSTATGDNYSLKSAVIGGGSLLFATHSKAVVTSNAAIATGIHGEAVQNTGTVQQVRGVAGIAQAVDPGVVSIGVYGTINNQSGNDWAGYFAGNVHITGQLWNGTTLIFSDSQLKTGVAPMQGASALLSQFQPQTYFYDTTSFGYLGLPADPQIGLLAQDVQGILPGLVKTTTMPAELDTLGNVLHPSMELMGIDYVRIVPILLAGFQEQQAQIDQQSIQIQLLQQQLAQCCASDVGNGVSRSQETGVTGTSIARETDLRIIPNPVAANTQLRYTLANEGRVRLQVSDSMGRLIEVLDEGERTEGEFTYQWNTSKLAPGTYYCTLLVNGEPLVKRAVQLNER